MSEGGSAAQDGRVSVVCASPPQSSNPPTGVVTLDLSTQGKSDAGKGAADAGRRFSVSVAFEGYIKLIVALLDMFAKALAALAWPVATICIAYVFRGDLAKLLGRLRSAKVGSAEMEFQQAVEEAVENVEVADEDATKVTAEEVSEAAQYPREAVLNGWLAVEEAAKKALNLPFMAVSTPYGKSRYRVASPTRTIADLRRLNILDDDDVDLFERLRKMRNTASHDISFKPTADSVVNYVVLARQLAEKINERSQAQ